MSMSDDPRGFRRGQGGGRDYRPPRQGHGGRAAPPSVDDRYEGYRQPEAPGSRPQQPQEKPAPSFSAYRPEAYANHEAPPPRSERPEWDNGARRAPPPPDRSAPPPSEPYGRTPPPSRDPYYQNASSDPYAPRSPRGYEADWDRDAYSDGGSNQFPSYLPSTEEPPAGPDAQSVHDRFFAAEKHGDAAPPPPARVHSGFHDQDFDDRAPQSSGNQPAHGYANEPAPQHRDIGNFDTAFDDGQYHDWNQYDQAPPPSSARPFQPPAMADEDLDADFFADEDEYDADDYEPDRKGGRKKLMAAVLVGAIAIGGGLAYVYKFSNGDGGGIPSLIAADSSPVKEAPSEPGGRDFPNRNKLIYDRLGGEEPTATRLASGESPAEPQSESASASEPIPGIVTTGGTLEERIENALKAQGNDGPATTGETASADKPRTVRTVTFGPDGNPQPAEPRTQRIAANDANGDAASSGVVVTTAQTVDSSSASNADQAGQSSGAQQQPETQIAAISPQPRTPEVTESSGGTGNYFVQIGARNDQEAAIAAFATLQQKYSSVIGNYAPSVRKADLGAKGVWYRLLVGPVESKIEADALCEQLKGAGMKGCFARKD